MKTNHEYQYKVTPEAWQLGNFKPCNMTGRTMADIANKWGVNNLHGEQFFYSATCNPFCKTFKAVIGDTVVYLHVEQLN